MMADRGLVARYGGEEFAVIVSGVDVDEALAVAENLRNAVANKKLVRRASGETLGRVTFSAGVAGYIPGEGEGDLIERADNALYQAKRAGRNRVTKAEFSLTDTAVA
jgi:diguanylate cyclase